MNILKILLDEQGTTLAITRVTSGAVATAAIQSTRDAQVEAVVNGNIDSDSNIAADGVKAVALNSDVVRSGYGLSQHSDGSLQVDPSDTTPGIEITDGGVRAKVYGMVNRTSNGIEWGRTGDVVFSSSATTPDGFTDISSTYANKMVRIGTTALSSGGSDTLSGTTDSHVLTTAEIPTHTHPMQSVNRADGAAATGGTGGGSDYTTGVAGSGGGHTHTLTAISCLNAYVSLKAYQKS